MEPSTSNTNKQNTGEEKTVFSIGAMPYSNHNNQENIDFASEEQQEYSPSLPGRQPVRYSEEQSPFHQRGRKKQQKPIAEKHVSHSDQGTFGHDGFSRQEKRRKKKKTSHKGLYIGIILLSSLLLVAIGFFMFPQLTGKVFLELPNYAFVNGKLLQWEEQDYQEYVNNKQILLRDTFFPGIFVDGVSLEGKTFEEAQELLKNTLTEETKRFSVSLALGAQTLTINSDDVPIEKNIDEVLLKAYAIGRQNNLAILGTSITPFTQ
ncbi:MAG: hypothetical protein GX786_07770, partial [Clostridiales bacterium]|nr:hypothetical protein [Clostridiales bacterium]